jgi:hypothetical protein
MTLSATRANICKQLLLAAVRFALKRSIRLRELLELLKQALVENAIEELRLHGSPVTAARLSVMTGVHRKDVDRLINQSPAAELNESSLISRIIGQWRANPLFSDKIGRPRILSLENSGKDFAELARSVTTELNPSLVLAELERVGAVKRHRLGLKLVAHVYVPSPQETSYYDMLAEDSQDLVACIEHNVSQETGDKNLHIKTEYDGIPDELLPEVSEWILREGSLMHKKFAEYLSSKDKDTNPALRKSQGRNRVAVTSFGISAKTSEKQGSVNSTNKKNRRK